MATPALPQRLVIKTTIILVRKGHSLTGGFTRVRALGQPIERELRDLAVTGAIPRRAF